MRIPVAAGIRTWRSPTTHVPCDTIDAGTSVRYDKAKDTLTFKGMIGMDKNYVQVKGSIPSVHAGAPDQMATFKFSSPDVKAPPLDGEALPTTTAWDQLAARKTGMHQVWGVLLRSIDIAAALQSKYRIKLLAIDIAMPRRVRRSL